MISWNSKNKKSGFSVIEMLIYMSILIIVSSVVVSIFVTYGRVLSELKAKSRLTDSAVTVMERLVYEIRNADALDPYSTTLDVDNGTLGLQNVTGEDVYFELTGGQVTVTVGAEPTLVLSPDNVEIETLRFHKYDNPNTDLVRVIMTISATSSDTNVTETFYGASVLRGSYD